jgi:hypothetical protein
MTQVLLVYKFNQVNRKTILGGSLENENGRMLKDQLHYP